MLGQAPHSLLHSQPLHVSISEAARRLKVSSSTVQRMCNRGLLEYETTQGGHRRISLAELSKIASHLHGQEQANVGVDASPVKNSSDVAELLLSGAQAELFNWLMSDTSIFSISGKLESELYQAIIELDNRYLRQAVSACQLWIATSALGAVLGKVSARLNLQDSSSPVAIGGVIDNAQGELGTRYVEIGLRLCGWNAIGLTGSLTAEGLADAAHSRNAAMVFISHSHITEASRLVGWHRALAAALSSHIDVMVGGGSLSPAIRRQLPPHTYCESISELIRVLTQNTHSSSVRTTR